MSFGECFICGKENDNSVCGGEEGFAHPACYYRRESERPRDEVITQLRMQVRRLAAGIREQHPCVICRWPRPFDNEHNICECCGFQEGYDNVEAYIWDGRWWAAGVDREPLIVERLRLALRSVADNGHFGAAWLTATASTALGEEATKAGAVGQRSENPI